MLKLNNKMKIRKQSIGNEKTEILIIDDVIDDIKPLINHALNSAYFDDENQSFYPGKRANLPSFYLDVINDLIEKLRQDSSILNNFTHNTTKRSAFSILTQDEKTLFPEQCIPHYDSVEQNYFALTHYLNDGQFGGTAFYRHKLTNIEIITRRNIDEYFNSLNTYIQQNGLFELKYFSSSTDLFELIAVIPYCSNRLLIYPGAHLHSIYLDDVPANTIDSIEFGRLTANLFVQFE